ncbi:MAG: SRPBCC domain-containing protein [Acidobacteriaceae bacterium]|nr:SRPBCC domain-containing protein [Acidobacteriaceae bacterium]
MSTTIATHAIFEEITIQAPAERIFDALTRPSEILKWWRADGKFQTTHFENDLRVGGKWMIRVAGSCGSGTSSVVKGEYHAIEYLSRPPVLHMAPFWRKRG